MRSLSGAQLEATAVPDTAPRSVFHVVLVLGSRGLCCSRKQLEDDTRRCPEYRSQAV